MPSRSISSGSRISTSTESGPSSAEPALASPAGRHLVRRPVDELAGVVRPARRRPRRARPRRRARRRRRRSRAARRPPVPRPSSSAPGRGRRAPRPRRRRGPAPRRAARAPRRTPTRPCRRSLRRAHRSGGGGAERVVVDLRADPDQSDPLGRDAVSGVQHRDRALARRSPHRRRRGAQAPAEQRVDPPRAQRRLYERKNEELRLRRNGVGGCRALDVARELGDLYAFVELAVHIAKASTVRVTS